MAVDEESGRQCFLGADFASGDSVSVVFEPVSGVVMTPQRDFHFRFTFDFNARKIGFPEWSLDDELASRQLGVDSHGKLKI